MQRDVFSLDLNVQGSLEESIDLVAGFHGMGLYCDIG